MAEQEFFSINPSTHIRTTSENRRFYSDALPARFPQQEA